MEGQSSEEIRFGLRWMAFIAVVGGIGFSLPVVCFYGMLMTEPLRPLFNPLQRGGLALLLAFVWVGIWTWIIRRLRRRRGR